MRVGIIGIRLGTVALCGVGPFLGPLLLLFGALLEEDFPEYIFLLLVAIVILYVVVVGLVENTVVVVIAIRVLVPDASRLGSAQSLRVCIRVHAYWEPLILLVLGLLLGLVRASD